MVSDSRAADIIGYSFLVMFANDATIDADELRFLEHLALADRTIDESERSALQQIFARVDPALLAPSVSAEIAAFRVRYSI